MLGPTWMDDLCITISHPTAKGIEHKAGTAASVLLETCTYQGVTPNLDKGKSEILFTFRGCGSRSLRTKYFSENNGRTMPVVTEHGSHRISVVGNIWAVQHITLAAHIVRCDVESLWVTQHSRDIDVFSFKILLLPCQDVHNCSNHWYSARLFTVWSLGHSTN